MHFQATIFGTEYTGRAGFTKAAKAARPKLAKLSKAQYSAKNTHKGGMADLKTPKPRWIATSWRTNPKYYVPAKDKWEAAKAKFGGSLWCLSNKRSRDGFYVWVVEDSKLIEYWMPKV